jgi:hypothetical protein
MLRRKGKLLSVIIPVPDAAPLVCVAVHAQRLGAVKQVRQVKVVDVVACRAGDSSKVVDVVACRAGDSNTCSALARANRFGRSKLLML